MEKVTAGESAKIAELVTLMEKEVGHCCGDVLNITAEDLSATLSAMWDEAYRAGLEEAARFVLNCRSDLTSLSAAIRAHPEDFDWQCENCKFTDDPTIYGKPAICPKCGWNRWVRVAPAVTKIGECGESVESEQNKTGAAPFRGDPSKLLCSAMNIPQSSE